jgi:CheY-like chemotaxis protein
MELWVIDDDTIYQMLVKRMVEKNHPGVKVEAFLNGKPAYEAFLQRYQSNEDTTQPSIIFLDINMPVMNGWEFLNSLLKSVPEKKITSTIYIVSSSIDRSDFEKADSYSIVSKYLVKPITKNDLETYLK